MSVVTNGEATKPKQATIRQQLESEAFKNSLSKILPKHVTPDRMARVAILALTRTPLLSQCTQASFFRCLMDLSQWGIEPDGRRAHLIPFYNNKEQHYECQLIIDYKGIVELVYRSGVVANIHADIVCENDDFVYDRGELVRHKINFKADRGKMYAVYCLVRMKDGTEKCEVLTKQEVDGIRARSKAGKSGPWVSDYNEMAKKTAFRRVSKWIPLSAEIRDAALEDDDTIDGEIIQPTKSSPRIGLDDLTLMIESEERQPEPEQEPEQEQSQPEEIPVQDAYVVNSVKALLSKATTMESIDEIVNSARADGVTTEAIKDELLAAEKRVKKGS
jgi:recombination protein RecT